MVWLLPSTIHRQLCDYSTWEEIKNCCHLHIVHIRFVPKTTRCAVTNVLMTINLVESIYWKVNRGRTTLRRHARFGLQDQQNNVGAIAFAWLFSILVLADDMLTITAISLCCCILMVITAHALYSCADRGSIDWQAQLRPQ